MVTNALAFAALILELIIIVRGIRGRAVSSFPLFFSYVGYMFFGIAVTLAISWYWIDSYPYAYWIYYLISLLAEFAVLAEIADHAFRFFPAVRRLGHVLTVVPGILFGLVYVLPPLLVPGPRDVLVLEIVKRASVVKIGIIVVLVAGFRYFHLAVGRSVSGLLLGFSIYLATNVANFALAEEFGATLYEQVFRNLLPASFNMALMIWTVTLWRFEPVRSPAPGPAESGERGQQPVAVQLGKIDTALDRLFRR